MTWSTLSQSNSTPAVRISAMILDAASFPFILVDTAMAEDPVPAYSDGRMHSAGGTMPQTGSNGGNDAPEARNEDGRPDHN